MKLYKKLILGLLLVTAVTAVSGCGQKPAEPVAMEKLKIGILPTEDSMPMLVGQKNGYFAAENVELELVKFQSTVELSSAMQSGALDGMMNDMVVASMIKDSGQALKVTSITLGATPQEGRFGIAVSPQSGIKTMADLKGKQVGISFNSIIEYVTDGLLAENGMLPTDIEKVAVPKLPVRLELLMSSKIDAAVLPDPLLKFAEFQGATIIAADTQAILSQSVLIFDQKTLDGKRDALQAFYRAYAKSVDDLNNHPTDYQQLLIDNVNIPAPLAKDYQMQHYPQPQVPNEADVDKLLEWMRQKELLKNPLSYQDLVEKI